MQNVTIHDLRAVATIKEIADAFGVSHPAVLSWERKGKIPYAQLYRYDNKKLPNKSREALYLHNKALAYKLENGETPVDKWREIRDNKRAENRAKREASQ